MQSPAIEVSETTHPILQERMIHQQNRMNNSKRS